MSDPEFNPLSQRLEPLSEAPTAGLLPIPPTVRTVWDARLQLVWGSDPDTALKAASALFTPEDREDRSLPGVEEKLAAEFRRLLTHEPNLTLEPRTMPPSLEERYCVVMATLWLVLKTVRQTPSAPFVEDYLEVALRPVRKLSASPLTPMVCMTLYDYQRGLWTPHLTRPQLLTIRLALGRTLAALPPEEMTTFWEELQSHEPMRRQAMQIGLAFLCSAHCVPHLLTGLEQSIDHDIRASIVDCLEQISDPRALGALMRLRRETALADWPLSRHIARAIRVIEQQNRHQSYRTLLRPSATPPEEERSLLRPAQEAEQTLRRQTQERDNLLRADNASAESSPQKEEPDES